jgi:chromosome condensin MukBEF MukE localization factor
VTCWTQRLELRSCARTKLELEQGSRAVDLYKAIRELIDEKKRIERIISSLEAMQKEGMVALPGKAVTKTGNAKRRGRKSMSPEERREVSERMARYWEARRRERIAHRDKEAADGSTPGPGSATS